MKKFKFCTVFALLLSLCLIMTGCHGSQDSSAFAVPETFDTSRTYEITFWAKNDTNRSQTAVYEKALESFQALYPNIHETDFTPLAKTSVE